jgi:hypothetical protein
MKIELTRSELVKALQYWVEAELRDKSLVVTETHMKVEGLEVILERKANIGATGKSSPAFPGVVEPE